MKHIKKFEGILDWRKPQQSPAKKIYNSIVNKTDEISNVSISERTLEGGSSKLIRFEYNGTKYTSSEVYLFNEVKYELKMGKMVFDCSDQLSQSIFKKLKENYI